MRIGQSGLQARRLSVGDRCACEVAQHLQRHAQAQSRAGGPWLEGHSAPQGLDRLRGLAGLQEHSTEVVVDQRVARLDRNGPA
jgi:hypothetical protein